jgi:hypothetical protein
VALGRRRILPFGVAGLVAPAGDYARRGQLPCRRRVRTPPAGFQGRPLPPTRVRLFGPRLRSLYVVA